MLAGQHFADWIDVVMAREALLLDRDGEFRDVFEEEDGCCEPKCDASGPKSDANAIRKRRFLLELAELALEDGDDGKARELLEGAVSSGGPAGPAWELLAALQRQAGDELAAHESYLRAAQSALSNPLRAMRFWKRRSLHRRRQRLWWRRRPRPTRTWPIGCSPRFAKAWRTSKSTKRSSL